MFEHHFLASRWEFGFMEDKRSFQRWRNVKWTGFQCWWVSLLIRMLIMLIRALHLHLEQDLPRAHCCDALESFSHSPELIPWLFHSQEGGTGRNHGQFSLCTLYLPFGQSASSRSVNISFVHPWHSGGLFQGTNCVWLAACSLLISWNVISLLALHVLCLIPGKENTGEDLAAVAELGQSISSSMAIC